ncbi:hypothetical protein H0H92_009317 [Tricholoma furcatifolium]|nr:hypothetical protein H0H92_009317 [Tricholoma furcatifolium]
MKKTDGKSCFFTGEKDNLDLVVIWIVPPILCYDLGHIENSKDTKEEQAKKHTVPANTITIREDLADDFRQNRIMIDVEMSGILPTTDFTLLQPKDIDARTLFYLQLHCSRGVLRETADGGMSEDYNMNRLFGYLNEPANQNLTLEGITEEYKEHGGEHLDLILQWLTKIGPKTTGEHSEDDLDDDPEDDSDLDDKESEEELEDDTEDEGSDDDWIRV